MCTVKETLDAPIIKKYEHTGMGVLVKGMEDARDHINSNKNPD
jgi:hypothetical protein